MGIKYFFFFLSLLCFTNETIILKHNNGNLWIKCEVNKNKYLDGKLYIYDFCGELTYYGCYKDGYHIDSSMAYKNRKLISKTFYKDSMNFEQYIYNDDTLYMKLIFINGQNSFNIYYYKSIPDTAYVIKGGEILKFRHSLEDIKRGKTIDCFDNAPNSTFKKN